MCSRTSEVRAQARPGMTNTGTRLLSPLPCQRRQRAALAIACVLVVDPVVRIDPPDRNAVTRPQYPHQNPPRRDLRLGRAAHYVGIIAGEFHADRIAADHLMKGRAVIDVFVVVAVGAVAMG